MIVGKVTAQRNNAGIGGRLHAGNGANAIEQLPAIRDPLLRRQIQTGKASLRYKNSLLLKSGVGIHELGETAREEQCARDQHERQSHLHYHQRTPQSESLATRRESAPAGLHRGAGGHAGGPQGGCKSEQNAGDDRDQDGKSQQAPVETEIENDRITCRAY